MKNAPSLFLLLMVATGPALGQQCTYESFVKTDNSNVTVKLTRTSTSVYLRPFPGFKGISLTVEASDGEEYTACFPKQDTCFQGDADFWEVSVAAWLSNNNSDNNNHHGLYFRMWTDGCPSQCYYTATVNKIERFMLTGHGHSAWSFSTPDSSCRVVNIWNIHLKDVVHCTTTLSLGTNSNNSGSIATIRHAMSSTRRHNTNTSATTTITKPTVPVSTLVVVVVVVVVSIVLRVLSAVAVRLALLVKELKKKKSRTHDDVLGVSGCRRCTVLQKPAGRLVREGTHRGRPLTALSITEHTQRTDRIGE